MSAVVYVEAEDDVRSVRARLERVEEGRVGLVLPASGRLFTSPVALRLLQRQAEALALDISVISSDPLTRDLARAEGLDAFGTVSSYERARRVEPATSLSPGSRQPVGEASSSLSPLGIAAVILIPLLILVALALVFVPEVTVVVYPRTEVISGTVQVVADPGQSVVDFDRRRIPARSVQLLVGAADELQPGEGQPPGDGRASGIVTFTNRTIQTQMIPKGSILMTAEGIRYITDSAEIVAAGTGKTSKVKIVAEVAGEQGNVPRLRVTTILGPLEKLVYVQNGEPLAGGGIPGGLIITAVDRDRLLSRVSERARSEAQKEILRTLSAEEALVEGSMQLTPLEVAFVGEIGQESRSVGVRYRGQVTGLIINSQALDRVVRQNWRPVIRPGFELVTTSVQARSPEVLDLDLENRVVTLSVQLDAIARAEIDTDQIAQLARWRSAAEVQRLLPRAYSLKHPSEIRFSPSWSERAYRVRVVVANERADSLPVGPD